VRPLNGGLPIINKKVITITLRYQQIGTKSGMLLGSDELLELGRWGDEGDGEMRGMREMREKESDPLS
jgi:hypothetical protein